MANISAKPRTPDSVPTPKTGYFTFFFDSTDSNQPKLMGPGPARTLGDVSVAGPPGPPTSTKYIIEDGETVTVGDGEVYPSYDALSINMIGSGVIETEGTGTIIYVRTDGT